MQSTAVLDTHRRSSIGFKLAVGTVAVIFMVSAGVYFALSAHERQSLYRSKELAASMVTRLFALSVGAAVQFQDEQGVKDALSQLRQNPEVEATAIFRLGPKGENEKLGDFARDGAKGVTAVPASSLATSPPLMIASSW